jgi:hypothetical protein
MGEISEHRNSLPQVSCMLTVRFPPLKEKVLKQGMKNMSKGFIFVVVPAEAVGFFLCKNPQHAFRGEVK